MQFQHDRKKFLTKYRFFRAPTPNPVIPRNFVSFVGLRLSPTPTPEEVDDVVVDDVVVYDGVVYDVVVDDVVVDDVFVYDVVTPSSPPQPTPTTDQKESSSEVGIHFCPF